MLGRLPKSLNVKGKEYAIRTDFRSVLRIIAAFDDEDLTDDDKVYVMLRQLYVDFESIPPAHIEEAYNQAAWFMRCGQKEDEKSSKIVYWEKDESLLFPAVNKAAGTEVRLTEYMHWWTFMGFFQSIDSESTYGCVLMLRQKRMKGKKLEKWEQEFWNSNRDICEPDRDAHAKDMRNTMQDLFNSLRGGED